MKVQACFSLVLAVLVVTAAGGEVEIDRGAFWISFFASMTAETCANENAVLCQANSLRCYGELTSDKYKVQTEQAAAWAKAWFTECAQRLSVAADFSDVTLQTFQNFPLPGYGFDMLGMFLHYGVPENKLSPMTECTSVDMLADLRKCLTSPVTNLD